MSDMNDCLNRSKNRDKACSHLSAIAEVNGKFPELQVRETRVSFSARAAVRLLMFQHTQGSERDDGKNERSGTFATRDKGRKALGFICTQRSLQAPSIDAHA